MKIMIVEDHAEMRRVLCDIAESSFAQTIEISEYDNGESAIDQYLAIKPDWVLMDIELKSMSGFDVAEKIYTRDKEAKIIIVTSYDTPSFRRKAKQLQTHGFVCKDNLTDLQQLFQNITT